MKLSKGSLKVIITDPNALLDNPKRARAGGKIFIPPYIVYEYTPSPADGERHTVETHYAFSVLARGLKPGYNHTKFPFPWAPRFAQDYRVWLETTDEVILVTQYEVPNV